MTEHDLNWPLILPLGCVAKLVACLPTVREIWGSNPNACHWRKYFLFALGDYLSKQVFYLSIVLRFGPMAKVTTEDKLWIGFIWFQRSVNNNLIHYGKVCLHGGSSKKVPGCRKSLSHFNMTCGNKYLNQMFTIQHASSMDMGQQQHATLQRTAWSHGQYYRNQLVDKFFTGWAYPSMKEFNV
jgi:hypothetical protein